jgi:hypothetical protein
MFGIIAFEMIDDRPQALASRSIELDKDRKMGRGIFGLNGIQGEPLFADHEPGKT